MNKTLVSQSSLFALLDENEQTGLTRHLTRRHFSDGQYVFHIGEPASSMYLVCSGCVQVTLETYEREQVILDRVEPGEVLGEISFFDGGPRTASASAVGETELLECSHDALLRFLNEHPHAALDLMGMMGKRLRKTDELLRMRVTRNANAEEAEQLTLGDRVADKVASFGGSWTFIFTSGGLLGVWVLFNSWMLAKHAFDPFPYILLNLILSMVAALQAPVIMMSQNRQSAKDRLKTDLDYAVNLKAELEVAELRKRVDAIHDLLKSTNLANVNH
jgi:CRP/FNR family cyclic AMP-dependent transcriptional regulator